MSNSVSSTDIKSALRSSVEHHDARPRNKDNAATGTTAAGARAFGVQFMRFYFRAPIKAFFRTRVDYMGYARAINPRIQAQERWSWRLTMPGLLTYAVRRHGWSFIPKQVVPPMLANVVVGGVLYTSYLQALGALYEPASRPSKRIYPPPGCAYTFSAGFFAGAVQSLVAAPLDALQVRFRANQMLDGRYTSMWNYARLKLSEIGVRGIFAGWGISLIKDSIGNGLFFMTFETLKSQAYYGFVTNFYGAFRSDAILNTLKQHTDDHNTQRPVIRPHYAIEPGFLLLAGVGASVAQQAVLHPLTRIQDIHYKRLEALDVAARRKVSGTMMIQKYYLAYQKTIVQCRKEADLSGGWRRWLFRGFISNTLRQVPSTSAGLIVFELVRRRYAWEAENVMIEKDGYDILLA